VTECCRRCKTPITQRNGVGRKKEFCSLACRRRRQYIRTTSANAARYNELRALGGYPNECRRSRWGGGYEALKVELQNRRQLG
jgi:hypothetical protein